MICQAECFHCKKVWQIEVSEGLVRFFYCGKCVRTCDVCEKTKPLNNFQYDYNSQAYVDFWSNPHWKGQPPPEAYTNTCHRCIDEKEQREKEESTKRLLADPKIQEMLSIISNKGV